MEGLTPPAALPPIASPTGFPPVQPGFAPRPAAPPGAAPVGRPAGDPEVQQQKIERNAEAKRVEAVLPKQMDSKLLIFRADKKGRVPFDAQPIMQFLLKDLEKANAEGITTDEIVEAKLKEKFNEGRFVGKFVDRSGRAMNPNLYPPYPFTLGEDDAMDPTGQIDPTEEIEDESPSFQAPPSYPSAPPPTQLDLSAISRMQDSVREQEARRGNEVASLVAGMQNSMTQMMAAFAQQQQQREDAARREAKEREEREDKRRSDFRTTLLTVLPLVLPMLQKIFGPREHGPDPSQQFMLEILKAKLLDKGSDASMMDQMVKLMGTMTQEQMKLQSTGAATAVQMQSEASSLVFKNMMTTMKELMENKPKSEKSEDEGMMKTLIKAAAPLLANIAQPQQQPAPGFQEQQAQAPAQPAQDAAPTEPVVRRAKVQPPPPPPPQPAAETVPPAAPRRRRPDPAQYSDDSRIAASLDTVRKMSTGEITTEQRFGALQWVAQWAPAPMIEAIKSGSREKVMEVGQGAVIANPVLLNWLATEGSIDFLEAALADLKAMLDGTLTQDQAMASMAKADAWVRQRQNRPVAGEVVKKEEPAAVTVTGPQTAESSAPSQPAAAAIPPVPRRRRQAPDVPAQPPAQPPVEPATAPPAEPPPADGPSAAAPEPPAPTAGG